jgi:hypothetical protein
MARKNSRLLGIPFKTLLPVAENLPKLTLPQISADIASGWCPSRLINPQTINEKSVGRNGFAEGGDGEVIERLDVTFRTGGRAVARRTINERRPPCRHYVSG